MLVRFWGTRGSLPVSHRADAISAKIATALVLASGKTFADEAAARQFMAAEMNFAEAACYGGATTCLEIEGGEDCFMVCDMGSGLREFGISAAKRSAAGHPKVYHFFMSHLHWDHIMGFPFFGPAFDPGATVIIHSGHADAEQALRRQQEEISFPVPFDGLRATFEFRHCQPGEVYRVGGVDVDLTAQDHSHVSYGWRFRKDGRTLVFSTDAEHRLGDEADKKLFEGLFASAHLVIADTMYSLAESITMKADWGHSSNIMAVDLCRGAGAERLVLFHHEPTYNDGDILRMHEETLRYEEISRAGRPQLGVICAYDGLEIEV